MPKKSTGGSKRKRAPGIKQRLLKELRAKRKETRKTLREIERDIRSLSGRKKQK